MWTKQLTSTSRVDCRKPYSFYFDLIPAVCQKIPNLPLHRICSLARKMGVQSLCLECALSRDYVRLEIDDLDAAHGGGGTASAVALTFFTQDTSGADLSTIDASAIIGQAIVINYVAANGTDAVSYVFEGLLRVPAHALADGGTRQLLNNYVYCASLNRVAVEGHQFDVAGVYYAQQNQRTSVCAHVCLEMALVTARSGRPSAQHINSMMNLTTPQNGMSLQQVGDVITRYAHHPLVFNCDTVEPDQYMQVLHSLLDSGMTALLVFTTAQAQEHVVYVCGHTLNTDEWHPQALPAYSGAPNAEYYPVSAWMDHLIIHDDNFGPYLSLSSRSLVADPNIKAHWIVGLMPQPVVSNPLTVQVIASVWLKNMFNSVNPNAVPGVKWLAYVCGAKWPFVLRTTLMTRGEYITHLETIDSFNGQQASNAELSVLTTLPDYFWCTEYTLPNLFVGNRSKLGEVITDATIQVDPANPLVPIVATRGPGFFAVKQSGAFKPSKSGITSHATMYQRSPHDHQW